ncbi:MAG: gliding motility-associated C-terminal domain-containing protein [Bacteroidetes bacterium]|nr:gliding motility-associated C-terminal domain-containing protein [Bacteroidota bacterium]
MSRKSILIFAASLLLFCLATKAQPLNDDCFSASPITISASGVTCVNGTLAGATDDGQFSTCENAGSKEVWFTYIATGSNNQVVVRPTGTSPASNLVVNITNTTCGFASLNDCDAATTSGGTATVNWGYSPGSQIWVSVSSNSGSVGSFEICITSVTTPPSDGKDCSTAVPVCSQNSFTAPVTVGANGYTPPCFTSALQQPIIFKFTVGQTGLLNWKATPTCTGVDAAFTEFDWVMTDITGGCPGTLVACNYNFTASGVLYLSTTSPQGMQGGPAAGCSRTAVTGDPALEICPGVTVTAGRTYSIILDQFTTTSTCDLNFDFSGSTFQLAPTAAFTVTPASGCQNLNVTFNNSSVAASSYAWTFGDGTTSGVQNPPSKIYSATGTYLVSLATTAASGCTSVASQSVQVIPDPVVSLSDTTICPGDSAVLMAMPDISGGTYSWSPGGMSTQSIKVSPASTTAYTVTYNLLSCTATATATVNVAIVVFTVNAGNDTAFCAGRSTVLHGAVQPPGVYTYQWSPAGTLVGAGTLTPTATPAITTVYTLTVADTLGCRKTDGVQVRIDAIPTISASVDLNTICPGQQVQLNAVVNPVMTPITWSPSTGSNAVSNPGIINPVASPRSDQKYVVVALNNSCAAADSLVVRVDTSRLDAGPNISACVGSGADLTANVIGNVLPGPASFDWTILGGTSIGATQTIHVNPSSLTTYVVTLNGGACVKRDTITVTIGNLSPNTIATNVTCNGAATGKVKTIISGTPPYSFVWSANANTGNVDSAINLLAGTYQVTVTDGSSCSGTASSIITEPTALTFTNSGTPVSCFGGNDGTLSVTPSGGTGAYSYVWSNTDTTSDITALSAGNYSVTVTDANGCSSSASIPVDEPLAPLASGTTVVTNLLCHGSGTGSIVLSISGGTVPYTYSWSHNTSLNNATASSLSAGTYTVTITDARNCSLTETNSITEPSKITFNPPTITHSSCGGVADGSIDINAVGGVGSYTYTWNGVSGGNPRTNLAGGNYTIVATDANNCTASTSVTINQPAPILVVTNITHASCYLSSDGSISLTVSGGLPPYRFNWLGLGNSKDINTLSGGTYHCSISDSNGCSVEVDAVINEPEPLTMSLQSTGINCTDDWNGTISVFPSGGTAPYSYSATQDGSYFFFSEEVAIQGLPNGLFQVILADDNGCVYRDTISVADAIPDGFIFATDSTSCFGDQYNDGAIYITETTLANRPYQYSVDSGELQLSSDFYNLSSGAHILLAVNQYGCETKHTIVVPEPVDAFASILPSDTIIQLGQSVELQTVFGPYSSSAVTSYSWTPSLGLNCTDCANPYATPYTSNNEYKLLITYNKICTVSASVKVNMESRPEIFIPNSFSPNGDGNNDVFQIYGAAIKTTDLKIFNRWGELVFQSTNQFYGWDGTYKDRFKTPVCIHTPQ